MAEQWYSDSTLLRNFGKILTAAGVMEDSDDLTAFLDQPQRYNEFYEAWSAAGFPTENDENWDEFVELVSSDDDSDDDDDDDDDDSSET